MSSLHIGIIGTLAGICTSISFIPQIVKIIRTRHVRDISLMMYMVLTTGIFLWLVYGILIRELPIIMANSAGFVLCSYIIFAKIRYGGRDIL